MMNPEEKLPPIVRLRYQKGDLILKEGDYGVSVYKIISGRVRVYTQSAGQDVMLATLGPGDLLAEMAFLMRGLEPYSASARAMEETELEVWHSSRLVKDYEAMPPVVKFVVNQSLKRLARTNKLVAQLEARPEPSVAQPSVAKRPFSEDQRRYYRKAVEIDGYYRPAVTAERLRLPCQIKDLSREGVGVTVDPENALSCAHEIGEEYFLETTLPNGREISFTAKVVNANPNKFPGKVFLGMSFTHIGDRSNKALGFFLMN